ncbi:hypothetical protein PENTCL1PPCAC_14471, partial [Pristionchus entomophagus]
MVYILLHFNRTFTDEYSPIFEMFTALEFRILLCHFVLQGVVGMSSRLIVMYNQYFGTALHHESKPLIFASLSHIAMYSFFCGGYEKTPPESIIIVVVTEGTNTLHSWFWACALIYEYVSVRQLLIVFVCHFGIGAMLFAVILNYNKREKTNLEVGAQIDRYSIAFTYQIRENLVALRAVLGLTKRIVLLNIPLLSMAFFVRTIANTDRDVQKNFTFAFFDIMISIYPLIIAGYVPFSDPIFERSMLRLPYGKDIFAMLSFFFRRKRRVKESTATIHETDIYFKMLNNSI